MAAACRTAAACGEKFACCFVFFFLCKQPNLHTRRGPTRTRKKSSPQRASFVTLMIIYNSQVPCLCGPHSAAAWRLHAHLANNIRWWVSKKKRKVEEEELVWIRRDLSKCRIISDDIALTNTVPHHYVSACQQTASADCATNIDRRLRPWFDCWKSVIWFAYHFLVLVW